MTDTFSRNIAISGALHAAVLLAVFFKAVLIPNEPIEIRRAIRVDIVGLPQKQIEPVTLAPPPAPETSLPKKVEPAPAPKAATKPAAKPTANAQREALNRLKTMSALEKIQADVKESAEKKPAKTAVIAGNQVNAGNSLTGLNKIEYDRYFDELETKIRAQWNLPQWLADAPLKAQVQILIDGRGMISRKTMVRSSGNEVFDAKVMEALEGASPLPVPPQRLQGLLATSGIIMNFPE
ncbi:MAG TPA: TonB family protein [Bdellovibrionales bacterium]|nr:TonB family protein [Bdellovibrionales bacterium]